MIDEGYKKFQETLDLDDIPIMDVMMGEG